MVKNAVDRYYVSKAPSKEGFYEVHKQGCHLLPHEKGRVFLGILDTSNKAVVAGRNLFKTVCPCSCCLDNAVFADDGRRFGSRFPNEKFMHL